MIRKLFDENKNLKMTKLNIVTLIDYFKIKDLGYTVLNIQY